MNIGYLFVLGPPTGTEAGQDGVASQDELRPSIDKDIEPTRAGAKNKGKRKNKRVFADVEGGEEEETADGDKEPASDEEDDDENKKKPTSGVKKTKGKVGKDVKRKEPKVSGVFTHSKTVTKVTQGED
eukprot:6461831-Amphidinium_carterae.1